MSRLKHPVRAIREPFGKAGLVVAVIALIAALGGTALAASGALTGKQKKEVEKIAKKFQGTGPAGLQGPAGNPGTGSPGVNGQSVTTSDASVEECPSGGTKFTAANGTGKACNGEKGKTGKDGSPCTATCTLPPGKTLMGMWSVETPSYIGGPGNPAGLAPISFGIPLSAPLSEASVHYIAFGEPSPTECPGTPESPQAKAGNLCIYTSEEGGTSFLGAGDFTAGGVILEFSGSTLNSDADGSWAVTEAE